MQSTALELVVRTVDGECMPVPGLEIGVRYRYEDGPTSWSVATTDGEGVARFDDAHQGLPIEVEVFAGGVRQGTFDPAQTGDLILEL